MTPEQFELLLTTARILRAKIKDEIYADQDSDLQDMNEALAPFDPNPGPAPLLGYEGDDDEYDGTELLEDQDIS